MDYPTFEIDMEVKEKDNRDDFQEKRAKKTRFAEVNHVYLRAPQRNKSSVEATTTSPLHVNYTNVAKPLGK